MANVNDLPDNISGGESGHVNAHETIHQVLKVFKGQIDTLMSLLEGGGSEGVIDDSAISASTTWSSEKIVQGVGGIANGLAELSDVVDSKANNMWMYTDPDSGQAEDPLPIHDALSNLATSLNYLNGSVLNDIASSIERNSKFLYLNQETNEWSDPMTGDTVPAPPPGSVQEMLFMAYYSAAMAAPKYGETKKVIPGAVTAGISEDNNGFFRNPEIIGMNSIAACAVSLDTPSTSGPVVFRLVSAFPGGGMGYGDTMTIPEGETVISFDDTKGGPSMVSTAGNAKAVVVEVIEAGTGASGLSVQVVRR